MATAYRVHAFSKCIVAVLAVIILLGCRREAEPVDDPTQDRWQREKAEAAERARIDTAPPTTQMAQLESAEGAEIVSIDGENRGSSKVEVPAGCHVIKARFERSYRARTKDERGSCNPLLPASSAAFLLCRAATSGSKQSTEQSKDGAVITTRTVGGHEVKYTAEAQFAATLTPARQYTVSAELAEDQLIARLVAKAPSGRQIGTFDPVAAVGNPTQCATLTETPERSPQVSLVEIPKEVRAAFDSVVTPASNCLPPSATPYEVTVPVTITLLPTGHVDLFEMGESVVVGSPAAGCIREVVRGIAVHTFAGKPVTFSKILKLRSRTDATGTTASQDTGASG